MGVLLSIFACGFRLLRTVDIPQHLQIQPKLRGHANVLRQPPRQGHSALPRPPAQDPPLDVDILIQIGPVDTDAVANQSPIGALESRSNSPTHLTQFN